MKTISIFLFIFLASTTIQAENQWFQIYSDSRLLKKDMTLLIDDFEDEVKKINPDFSFYGMQAMPVEGIPAGYYHPNNNKIYLPTSAEMPKTINNFGIKVTGSQEGADRLAGLFYYGFFMPHEIVHGLQWNAKGKFKACLYQNEYEANRLALLYCRKKGK